MTEELIPVGRNRLRHEFFNERPLFEPSQPSRLGRFLGSVMWKSYTQVVKHRSSTMRSLILRLADLQDRVVFGLPCAFKFNFWTPNSDELASGEEQAGFEQPRTSTVETHIRAYRGLVEAQPWATRVVFPSQPTNSPMVGAVLAERRCDMQRLKHLMVDATVEGVNASDVIVNVHHKTLGWYSLSVPCALFLDRPTIGSRLPLHVWFTSERGIVRFGVKPGTKFQTPVQSQSTPRPDDMPPEPDDYDDPAQAQEYERRLHEYFHLK